RLGTARVHRAGRRHAVARRHRCRGAGRAVRSRGARASRARARCSRRGPGPRSVGAAHPEHLPRRGPARDRGAGRPPHPLRHVPPRGPRRLRRCRTRGRVRPVPGGGQGRGPGLQLCRWRGHPGRRSQRRRPPAHGGALSPGDGGPPRGEVSGRGATHRRAGAALSRRHRGPPLDRGVAHCGQARRQGRSGSAQVVPRNARQPLSAVPGRAAPCGCPHSRRAAGFGEAAAAGDERGILEQRSDSRSPGEAELAMPDLLAARSQMGVSLAFHIVFAVVGVAMHVMMVVADRRWHVTGHAIYLDLAKRWAKGTAILFAVGAVSGTVLSFELGLLWPEFMRFAGPIIGMPFSLEGFAFFTEAIFLGIYLYGWDRIPPRAHLAAGGIVALSGAASGVFVVIANAWMNAPTGFELAQGQPVNVDPPAAMANPAALPQAIHTTLAAYAATGLPVAGIHALLLLTDPAHAFHRRALAIALIVGAPAAVLQPISGDLSARH